MSNPDPYQGVDPQTMEGLVNPSNVNVVGRPPSILPSVPPAQRPSIPVVDKHTPSFGWGALLIAACLALGLLGSLAQYERFQFKAQRIRADDLGATESLIAAQNEDLGRFLAEPQTRLIRLTCTNSSPAVNAALLLNPAKQVGYLLCDQLQVLDHGVQYEIWATGASEEARQMAGIDARAGVSVYPFKTDLELKGANHVEITAGPRSSGNGPILVGDMD